MNQLLKTAPEITAWLNRMKIKSYTLVPDAQHGFIVNVNGDVDLTSKKLNSIPVKFNHVTGSFFCVRNRLKSLKGIPFRVDGSFFCDHNELTSIDFTPQIIGGSFSCSYNLLTTLKGCPQKTQGDFWCVGNLLTNLLDAPSEVGGNFVCEDNRLDSLKGSPEKVGLYFSCRVNQIKNLEFCPQTIAGNLFYCDNNPLLGESQKTTDFQTICQIHLETLIELEKTNLSNNISSNHCVHHVCKI